MVKKGFLVLALGLFFSFPVSDKALAENKYVGADKCKLCHQSESKGNQYAIWKKSKHALAYADLATDKAKEIGAKQGITNPQQSEKCLKCHSLAALANPANLVAEGAKIKPEDGVQCESCHGAGEKYWSMLIMKDHDKAVANGLVVPNEAVCVKCHNPESTGWTGSFDFAEKSKIIAHQLPKK
jgi:Cytochrome c554 and c-prime